MAPDHSERRAPLEPETSTTWWCSKPASDCAITPYAPPANRTTAVKLSDRATEPRVESPNAVTLRGAP